MAAIKVKGVMQRVAVIDQNKAIAKPVRYSTVKGSELVSYAAGSSHIPASQLLACTLAIREAVSYFVLNGHHVDLGKFGYLGMRGKIGSAMDPEYASADLVKRVTVGYTPSTDIKQLIANIRITTEV
jgi:hypothetical protein